MAALVALVASVTTRGLRGMATPRGLGYRALALTTQECRVSAVPVSRPHHAYWPRRLPRELVLPETSLWFNLEVAATRYPHKAASGG